MASVTCPFCGITAIDDFSTHRTMKYSFEAVYNGGNPKPNEESSVCLHFCKCPDCGKVAVFLQGASNDTRNIWIDVVPRSIHMQFPDYIPKAIRDDYEEAYLIVDLSPKAAATLARRCIQGMIRNFHGIVRKQLVQEINDLKPLIPADQWKVIDSVRNIGNIGAHMEKDIDVIVDIDPGEARTLLKLIEYLVKDWYIARHDRDQMFADIVKIDQDTANQKKGSI